MLEEGVVGSVMTPVTCRNLGTFLSDAQYTQLCLIVLIALRPSPARHPILASHGIRGRKIYCPLTWMLDVWILDAYMLQ